MDTKSGGASGDPKREASRLGTRPIMFGTITAWMLPPSAARKAGVLRDEVVCWDLSGWAREEELMNHMATAQR